MSKIFVDIYDPWREEMCHLKNQKYLQQGKNSLKTLLLINKSVWNSDTL